MLIHPNALQEQLKGFLFSKQILCREAAQHAHFQFCSTRGFRLFAYLLFENHGIVLSWKGPSEVVKSSCNEQGHPQPGHGDQKYALFAKRGLEVEQPCAQSSSFGCTVGRQGEPGGLQEPQELLPAFEALLPPS